MRRLCTRPRCYAGCGKPVKPESRFCSVRCAAYFGGVVAGAGLDYWCADCRRWIAPMDCPHTAAYRRPA